MRNTTIQSFGLYTNITEAWDFEHFFRNCDLNVSIDQSFGINEYIFPSIKEEKSFFSFRNIFYRPLSLSVVGPQGALSQSSSLFIGCSL